MKKSKHHHLQTQEVDLKERALMPKNVPEGDLLKELLVEIFDWLFLSTEIFPAPIRAMAKNR